MSLQIYATAQRNNVNQSEMLRKHGKAEVKCETRPWACLQDLVLCHIVMMNIHLLRSHQLPANQTHIRTACYLVINGAVWHSVVDS